MIRAHIHNLSTKPFANVHFVPYGASIMVLHNKCHLIAHIACSKDATLRQRVTKRS